MKLPNVPETIVRRNFFFFNAVFALAAFIVDQLVKWFVLTSPKPLVSGDVLFLHYSVSPSINQAFAFSIPAPTWAIYAIVLPILAVVLFLWRHAIKGGRLSSFAIAMVIAGAVGNLVDRLRLGGVVDYMEIVLGNVTWSSFNLADVLIVGGAIAWMYAHSQKSVDPSW